MRNIKHALTERWYAWEDAVELAKTDPEVDMSGQGNAYTPIEYLEQPDEPDLSHPSTQGAVTQEQRPSVVIEEKELLEQAKKVH